SAHRGSPRGQQRRADRTQAGAVPIHMGRRCAAAATVPSPGLDDGSSAVRNARAPSRLITGRGDTRFPVATNANLDSGDLVAGNTQWDNDGDGIFFVETALNSPG